MDETVRSDDWLAWRSEQYKRLADGRLAAALRAQPPVEIVVMHAYMARAAGAYDT